MRPDTDMPEFLPQHVSAPWVPENAPTFKVGDRVRVTPGIAECTIRGLNRSPLAESGGEGHPVGAGAVGTVTDLPLWCPAATLQWFEETGHIYAVKMDSSFTVGDTECNADNFAPSELEPISYVAGVDRAVGVDWTATSFPSTETRQRR